MKKKNQGTEKNQEIKEFLKTPRGQGLAFFVFYFFFFLFIAILSRTGGGSSNLKASDFQQGTSKPEYIESLSLNNYEFIYTVTIDQNVYQYKGQRYLNKMLFEYNNKKYYYDGEKYYKQDGEWTECDDSFISSEFLDPNQVISLLNASSYESITTYESGKINYNYLLSSNTIFSILKGINTDYFENPNSIIVGINEDNYVEKVLFQLDSYGHFSKICQSNFKILLEFDQYGKIKEIESPIR